MREQTLHALVAAEALESGVPLGAVLRTPGIAGSHQARFAAAAADGGRLPDALRSLGFDPLTAEAAARRPSALAAILARTSALPRPSRFTASLLAALGYACIVLLLEALIGVILREKVIPVFEAMPAGGEASLDLLAALAADLLGAAISLATGVVGLCMLAVPFLSGSSRPTWLRPDLRLLREARAAATAAGLLAAGGTAAEVRALAAHHPGLASAPALTAEEWDVRAEWLALRAGESSATLVRRARIAGGLVTVLVGLVLAGTVFLRLPLLVGGLG